MNRIMLNVIAVVCGMLIGAAALNAASAIDGSGLAVIETPAADSNVGLPVGQQSVNVYFKVLFGDVLVNGVPVASADPNTFAPKFSAWKKVTFFTDKAQIAAAFTPITQGGNVIGMEATIPMRPKVGGTGVYKAITFKAKVKSGLFPNPTNPAKLVAKTVTAKAKFTIKPNNVPVINSFTVTNTPPIFEGQVVNFTTKATDADADPMTWELDYGDGSPKVNGAVPSNGVTFSLPSHVYVNPGLYTATLKVQDWGGIPDEESLPLDIFDLNTPPQVTGSVTNADRQDPPVGGNPVYAVNSGKTVQFQYTASDPDGDPVVSYSLNFGDGSAPATGNNPAGFTTVNLSHAYPAASASYTATMTMSDGVTNGTHTMIVKINNKPTISTFTVTPSPGMLGGAKVVNAGTALLFTASVGDPENDPLSYVLDFGDESGASGAPTGGAILASKTYEAAGNHTVTLAVSDGADSATTTMNIHVNARPLAAIRVDPYQSAWGYPVTMDGLDSVDPDGDSLTYSWNFGDGSNGSGASVTHVYSGSGTVTQTVTLTATDPWGLASTAQFGLLLKGALTAEPMFDIVSPVDKSNIVISESLEVEVLVGRATGGALPDMSTLEIKIGRTFVTSYFQPITDPLRNNQVVKLVGSIPLSLLDSKGNPVIKTDGKKNRLKVKAKTLPFQKIGGGIITQTDSDRVKFTATVNLKPVAVIASPAAGATKYVNEAFTFSAAGSSDPEGQPLTYTWIFGDGQSDSGLSVPHAYAQEGDYNPKLSVSDGVWTVEVQLAEALHVVAVPVNPGVILSQTGGSLDVSEAGQQDTYTVVLNTQPAADVTISMSTAPAGQITVTPGSLIFSPSNWNTIRVVTVAAIDDSVVEGSPHTATINHAVSSADPVYNNIGVSPLTVNITDNDVAASPGVRVTQTGGGTSVTEGGSGDSFSIVLDSQPASGVTVAMSFDAAQIGLSPTSAVFTAGNWSTPQTVTVTAVDDAAQEANPHTTAITFGVSSADPAYNNFSVAPITVSIFDNDGSQTGSGVIITQTGGSTQVTEGGANDELSMVLEFAPQSGTYVEVSMVADVQGQVSFSPPSHIFTNNPIWPAFMWDVPRVVEVSAVYDFIQEPSPHTVTISFSVVSTDPAFNGLSIPPITVSITDADLSGNPAFAIEPGTVAFGDLDRDMFYGSDKATIEKVVTVRNTGSETVQVTSVSFAPSTPTAFKIRAGTSGKVLLPGDVHSLHLAFAPTGAVPEQDWNGVLVVRAKVGESPDQINIADMTARTVDTVSGAGPHLTFSGPLKPWVSFGNVDNITNAGNPATRDIGVIANQGTATVNVSGVQLTGPDAQHFQIQQDAPNGSAVAAGTKWSGKHTVTLSPVGLAVSRRLNAIARITMTGGATLDCAVVADWAHVADVLILHGAAANKPVPYGYEFERIASNGSAFTRRLGTTAGTNHLEDAILTITNFVGGNVTVNLNVTALTAPANQFRFHPAYSASGSSPITQVQLTAASPTAAVEIRFKSNSSPGHHSAFAAVTSTAQGFPNKTIALHGSTNSSGNPGLLGGNNSIYIMDTDNFVTTEGENGGGLDLAKIVQIRSSTLSTDGNSGTLGSGAGESLYAVFDPFLNTGEADAFDLAQWEDADDGRSDLQIIAYNAGETSVEYVAMDSEAWDNNGPYVLGDPANTAATNNRLAAGLDIQQAGIFYNNGWLTHGNQSGFNLIDFKYDGSYENELTGVVSAGVHTYFYTEMMNDGGVIRTRLFKGQTQSNGTQVGLPSQVLADMSQTLAGTTGLEVSDMRAIPNGTGYRLFVTTEEARHFKLDLGSTFTVQSVTELTNLYPASEVPVIDYRMDRLGNWYIAEDFDDGWKVWKIDMLTGAGHPASGAAPWVNVVLPAGFNDSGEDADLGLATDKDNNVYFQTSYGIVLCPASGAAPYFVNVGHVIYAKSGVSLNELSNAAWDVDFTTSGGGWFAE